MVVAAPQVHAETAPHQEPHLVVEGGQERTEGAQPSHGRRGGSLARSGRYRTPAPTPPGLLAPPASPLSREGPGSRRFPGASAPSLSARKPGAGLGSGVWRDPSERLSAFSPCRSCLHAPCSSLLLDSPVSGCRPQLSLFPNCTVWPVAAQTGAMLAPSLTEPSPLAGRGVPGPTVAAEREFPPDPLTRARPPPHLSGGGRAVVAASSRLDCGE